MKGFCPSCERETELVLIQKIENVIIKGENIPIQVNRFLCQECGEEFDNPCSNYDPLAAAFAEYRRRKGMVQPEQIRSFREKYNLSQKELSDLLGFGGATLSRYENGALQDEAHDTIMRLIIEPYNLQQIIQEKGDVLSSGKRQAILQKITQELNDITSFILLKSRTANQAPSLLNGYRKLDMGRVLGAVKILIYGKHIPKTKLNKLLFYADFLHFKRAGVSITGLCYVHLPYGPVPDQYELIFQKLLDTDPDLRKEEEPNSDYGAEYFSYEKDPGSAGLSLMETQTLLYVKECFKDFSARRMIDFSHLEPAYLATAQRDMISYAFAEKLRI